MDRALIARFIGVAFGLGMLGACSAGNLDGFSGGDEPNTNNAEAGTETDGGGTQTDATVTTDSGSSGGTDPVVVDPNAIIQDTFETGSLCTPWVALKSSAVTAAPGHTGNASCKICTMTGGGGMTRTIKPKAPATTFPAGEYVATAWVHGAPYTGAVGLEAYRLTSTNTRGTYMGGTPPGINVTAEWTAVQIRFTMQAPEPGIWLEIFLDNGPPVNSCFITDDITITQQ